MIYYDPRTGFCDFNPCMSETSWDGEVISDTMERGLDEEFKTEIDRRLSFPEIVNERRGRQEFGFSVAEISELRRIDSIKKSNEKKGNDDRSRKAIVTLSLMILHKHQIFAEVGTLTYSQHNPKERTALVLVYSISVKFLIVGKKWAALFEIFTLRFLSLC